MAVTQFAVEQLSFEVGGEHSRPTTSSIGITGKGVVKRELYMDDDVSVHIVDADGVIVADFQGRVVAVDFKKHEGTENTQEHVERVHKIKLA